ncbi:MAG: flagellar export protein FliJ [Acidobacteriota bacterium]
MKKNRYRLQPVLEVREQVKKDAAQRLATARQALADAEAELARRLSAVEDCRRRQAAADTKLAAALQAGSAAHTLLAHRMFLADLREEEKHLRAAVEQQRAAVRQAEAAVEEALQGLIEASKEVQAIEKHKENWQLSRKMEAERRENKSNDEFGTSRHGRRE